MRIHIKAFLKFTEAGKVPSPLLAYTVVQKLLLSERSEDYEKFNKKHSLNYSVSLKSIQYVQETDESVDSLMPISDLCTIILFANNCLKDCKKNCTCMYCQVKSYKWIQQPRQSCTHGKAMEVSIDNKKIAQSISAWGDNIF